MQDVDSGGSLDSRPSSPTLPPAMLSFVLRLWVSFWLALGARLRGRPLRAGWSFGFEVIARTLKSNAARVSRLDWAAQRKAWEAMVQPSPILAKLRFERATIGGVSGEWFIPLDAPERGPVLLYLHGGSFIYGSIASTHRELIAREAVACGARTFAADYRLAPEHPFPAAIDDAVAAYRGLLASGVAASRVVVGGESAGGNLALVTILRARAEGVPLPAGAVLACPWVDLTARGGSLVDNAPFDWAEPRDSSAGPRRTLPATTRAIRWRRRCSPISGGSRPCWSRSGARRCSAIRLPRWSTARSLRARTSRAECTPT
jgi:acetyl esterase/lipase